MCVDPVSGLLAGANAAFSLYGASQSSRGAYEGAQSQATRSLMASQIADANARMALIEASGRMGQVDRRAEEVIGNNVADAAARGLAPNVGSPLLNQAFVASQANIDKKLIAARAQTEAANFYTRGAAEAEQGREALMAARYGAGTAWLQGLRGALAGFGGLKWGAAPNATTTSPASFNPFQAFG